MLLMLVVMDQIQENVELSPDYEKLKKGHRF